MRQFDVVANPFPHSRGRQPYLVSLQSDLLAHHLDTVVVAPLEPATSTPVADRLNPRVTIAEASFALITQEMATVRKSMLGEIKASIAEHRDAITAALDLLFTGF